MEPTDHPLLLKLGPARYDREPAQLLWPCPLSQEEALVAAPLLMASLECTLGPVEQGADRLYWPLEFEGTALSLQYEALCDSLWIQAGEGGDTEGDQVVAFLARLAGASV
ncbi:DUF3630 family protein [Ferrimonas balearica]|uniref:DUF3630 family protein n=1 Tax=Ferrimonas balearica TaxID=44012 RepID=UPI001C99BD90|nr:DUF3630 family protein [Ferrimonas balearica]MBY5993317.1 DUF3630 family protein [Ferrimonas balearica]